MHFYFTFLRAVLEFAFFCNDQQFTCRKGIMKHPNLTMSASLPSTGIPSRAVSGSQSYCSLLTVVNSRTAFWIPLRMHLTSIEILVLYLLCFRCFTNPKAPISSKLHFHTWKFLVCFPNNQLIGTHSFC